MEIKKYLLIIVILIGSLSVYSQRDTVVLDQIAAKVGDEIILQSDIEAQYNQWLASGNSASKDAMCHVLENLLIQKLLINQAKIDSLQVTDDEVDRQVDARLNMFINQLGGEAQLENYLNKSMYEIKNDLKKSLKDQLLAQKERQKITDDVKMTPSEVAKFFSKIPKDSIPLVDETYEIRQIVLNPIFTKEELSITLDKLKDIRKKIVSGERNFASMARMYSDDPVSAKNGGDLGYMGRGELDPDFAAAAFSLKKGEVSKIVKTKYGYHIIQMIGRRGDRIDIRHILIRPYVPNSTKERTIAKADSIRDLIIKDSLTFAQAAMRFSDDKDTRNSGGLLFNPRTGNTKFTIEELPRNIKYDIQNLKDGELSKPIYTTNSVGNQVVKLYKIVKKIPAHQANIKEDYSMIYNMALESKKKQVFDQWLKEQQKNVYISIIPKYSKCKFRYKNWLK
jgi:peptidyl-prolyl cis-trans isomerase SurA